MMVSVFSFPQGFAKFIEIIQCFAKKPKELSSSLHFFAAKLFIFVDDRSLFLSSAIKPHYAQKALIMSLVDKTIPYP